MRDLKTENFLERAGFVYRFAPDFPIDKIDLAVSAANPARLNRKIDDNRCLDMAIAMEAGDRFPAIVLMEEPSGIIVITGMHRIKAATECLKPPVTTFDAYLVIEPDPYKRDLLMRSINCIEGKSQERSENLAHCVEMHRLYGSTIEALASAFHLPASAVRDHFRTIKFDDRAKELGVGELAKNLQLRVKQFLSAIRDDMILERTIRVIVATKMSTNAAVDMIKEINKASRSQKLMMKILDDREEQFAEEEARNQARFVRRRPDIPTAAMKPVRTIVNFSAKYGNDASKLEWGALERIQLARDLKVVHDAIDILTAWEVEMTAVQKQNEKKQSWKNSTTTGEQKPASSSPNI